LENLLAIRRLIKLDATPDNIRKLLTAAERNLADAKVTNISVENRFDAAYKAIMQCAMAALWAAGYRTSTSEPGHHQTAIQVLPLTLSVAADTVIVLDALRKQRNLSDYSGDSISDATLRECLVQAENLLRLAKQKLLMGE
jgi:uncharacterized protein (UPF0332 family)